MKKCKQCGCSIAHKKANAIFCSNNCKQLQFKRKKVVKDAIVKAKQKLKIAVNNCIAILRTIDSFTGAQIRFKIERIDLLVEDINFENMLIGNTLEYIAAIEKDAFYAIVLYYPATFPEWLVVAMETDDIAVKEACYYKYLSFLKQKKIIGGKRLEKLNSFRAVIVEHIESFDLDFYCNLLRKNITEFGLLKSELKKQQAIDLHNLPIIRSTYRPKSNNKRSLLKSYSGNEILDMDLDGIVLDGVLGEFLGEIQRERFAIALTGDSGAGKSTFSFLLAELFAKKGYSIGYFSLEAGITKAMQEKINELQLHHYNFEVFDKGTLEDVRLISSYYDCIIVDSFSSISDYPKDFEALRQDFQKVFFIVIFQKVNDGGIRGGASIKFNSTTTIDIKVLNKNHRIAVMKKSRYQTENFVYSISEKKLLKRDHDNINWKTFEKDFL